MTTLTKADSVYERMRVAIVTGRFGPGARLDQDDLADQLGVSRMPLRQALLQLAADGLVEMKPHRSATVAPLSRRALEELYAMRQALEGMITERAVGQLDSGVIAELDGLLGYMRAARAASDWTRFVVLDRHFHRAIYQESGYPRAVNAVDRLRDSSDRYVFAFASQHQGAVTSIAEHEAILRACKEGDANLARRLTETHIEHGSRLLAPLINEPSDGENEGYALPSAADT